MPQFPTTDTNLKLKDLVTYIGENLNLKTQYAGTLEVWEISNKDVGCYACLTEDGRVSSWSDFDSLKLVNAIEVVAKNMWLKGSAKSAYEDSLSGGDLVYTRNCDSQGIVKKIVLSGKDELATVLFNSGKIGQILPEYLEILTD